MPTTRAELNDRLATCGAPALTAVLEAADERVPADRDARQLAELLTRRLWWRCHSPLGQLLRPDTLDDILDKVTRRAGLADAVGEGSVERRLEALALAVLPRENNGPLRGDDLQALDPEALRRLRRLPWGAFVGATGAGGAVGARYAASGFLRWTSGPIKDLLPFVPKIGPIFVGARAGARQIAKFAPPVGVGLSVLAINDAMGPDYDRALPLLVGVGLLLRGAPSQPDRSIH